MSEPFALYITGKTKKITEFSSLKVGNRNVKSKIDCFEIFSIDGEYKVVGYKNNEKIEIIPEGVLIKGIWYETYQDYFAGDGSWRTDYLIEIEDMRH